MNEITEVFKGVVAELDGRYWGPVLCQGNLTIATGFGDIQNAVIQDPRFCKKPEDMTWAGSPYVDQLRRARLVPVTKTTTFVVGE